MKKLLLALLITVCASQVNAQTIYYWVGGAASASINAGANWNTSLDGSGSARPSSSGATDILIFNGLNLGGATTVTGPIIVNNNAGITAAQLKFINNANVSFVRNTTGTSTLTLNGGAGDDFVIEAGSTFAITSTIGSNVIVLNASGMTGVVSGNFNMLTTLQARIANIPTPTLPAGYPAGHIHPTLVFTAGSNFRTNITSASSAYAFGSSSQSTEKWTTFQAGSHLYYEGGFSPMGNSSTFSAIDFQTGSTWHHKAANALTGFGSFFNNKFFANMIVENGATLNADGPIYRIDTLTVVNGSTFITHTSGTTVVNGNMAVEGSFTAQATTRNNTLLFGGSVPQVISGSGTITVPAITVADNADVSLNRNISALDTAVTVYGKLNFNTFQLTGAGSFTSKANASVTGLTGTVTAGSSQITVVAGTIPNIYGMSVSGAGIPANTIAVNYSSSGATINLSKPATASGTGVALTFFSDTATLVTANPNGFDPVTGSVALTGTKTYQSGTGYIINAATTSPFGITTGSTDTHIEAGVVQLNAAITTNTGVWIFGNLNLANGKATIRSTDTVRIMTGATLTGNFNSSNYFVTDVNTTTGAKAVLRIDGFSGTQIFPVGSPNYYLPATIAPTGTTDIGSTVFEGITADATPNGVPLAGTQKQTKVNAVWDLERLNGTGNATLSLQWAQALEGTSFSTMADSVIGIIYHDGSSWGLPLDTGNNVLNVATATISSFGNFSLGAKPPAQAFVFNPLPNKTYGDADFNGGAISANTSQPIIYSSSNLSVATIVNNDIHIVGVGTTNITATQASDGFYPAVNMTQPLTVNKAPLTIKADDKTKPQGDPNPPLTATYTGFVNGETSSVLTSPVVLSTTATTGSAAGTYPITAAGATAANYNITFVSGVMTVTPRQNQTITFPAFPVKTYGNTSFGTGASSTNNTIPITYTSSNTAVATVSGSTVTIVGAGTTLITASQAGNAFYFPAPNVSQTLTVNKANLTVKAADTSRLYGQPNPPFTITYTGFVLGQNASALTVAPTATTTATTTSVPGYYPIVPAGGVSTNYNFIYTNGRLTVYPLTGTTETFLLTFMPASNTLSVRLYSPAVDLGDIYIYDIQGNLMFKKNIYIANGFMTYNFNLTVTASGIYVVHIVSKNLKLSQKVFIKQ
jgi:trimeric autotransporter adhesin